MKRFVDTRNQGLCANFAFFDTCIGVFEVHSDCQAWINWEEFKADYKGADIDRYRRLTPSWADATTYNDVDEEFYPK